MKNTNKLMPYIDRVFVVPEVFHDPERDNSDYEGDNNELRYEVSVKEPHVPDEYFPDIGYEGCFYYGKIELSPGVREWGWYTPTKEMADSIMAELKKKGLKPKMRKLEDE
jgi:hypothetical protein